MDAMTVDEPSKRIEKITVTSDQVEGLEDLTMDDTVWLKIKAKVLSIGKRVYSESDRKNPPEAEFEIIEGKVETTIGKKLDKMREATNDEELKDAFKGED